MKKIIYLFLLVSLPFFSSGQSGEMETITIGVERINDYEKLTYVFKEGKTLRIKTKEGNKIYSNHYNIYEEFIVLNVTDTILYEDIQMIKGKVYGDPIRKILGVGIAGYGIVSGYVGIVFMYVLYGGATWLIPAIPFTALTILGINMAGAKKFKSERWRVVVLPVNEKEINVRIHSHKNIHYM